MRLVEADLAEADLRRTVLRDADLTRAMLRNVRLDETDLVGADLSDVAPRGLEWKGAKVDTTLALLDRRGAGRRRHRLSTHGHEALCRPRGHRW